MIRDLLVAIVFFFGPMLVMFVLRNLAWVFKLWLELRRQRRMQPEVVDVTPQRSDSGPSLAFVALAILIGGLSAYLAWNHTRQNAGTNLDMQYVPAHLDAQGRVVPGRLVPKGGTPDSDSKSPH
ncbi:MAG TPA: hypothetical protein VNH42_02040 [Mariprofundaceae bacterium]|nr:hypothetical protein [Mariprofundaceae bacterium]